MRLCFHFHNLLREKKKKFFKDLRQYASQLIFLARSKIIAMENCRKIRLIIPMLGFVFLWCVVCDYIIFFSKLRGKK